MKEKLLNLLNNSYSPYSTFKVAAILVTKDGQEFKGVNVENASYGATICAERSAFVMMEKDKKIICMSNKGETKEYIVSDFCPYPFDEEDLNI